MRLTLNSGLVLNRGCQALMFCRLVTQSQACPGDKSCGLLRLINGRIHSNTLPHDFLSLFLSLTCFLPISIFWAQDLALSLSSFKECEDKHNKCCCVINCCREQNSFLTLWTLFSGWMVCCFNLRTWGCVFEVIAIINLRKLCQLYCWITAKANSVIKHDVMHWNLLHHLHTTHGLTNYSSFHHYPQPIYP